MIGLGPSAGGLQALKQFLAKLPPQTGQAYAVIQHLDPTHSGSVPEILQPSTMLAAREAAHGAVVRADPDSVNPSAKDLSLQAPKVSERSRNRMVGCSPNCDPERTQ